MGDSASIGSVYVDVLPQSDGFWARFQAETRAQASKVGDDLGSQIGKSIGDQIAKGIRDGLGKGTQGSPGKEPGRKSGDDFAGEFERVVKTRIDAALKALPKAQIGASATEAEQKIKDLRVQLDELSGKKVGVDIDGAKALAEVDRIKEELARLGGESPNIQVRTDTAAAVGELGAVNEEVDRLNGRTASVDVDTSAATGSISNLTAAGIGIGPSIIPGAAAAASAIAAITPAALGALAGLNILVLAATGVVGAVKAMSTADNQAQQSAVSLAGKQSQLASASDAVRTAQGSLANAVANAADQQARASESISNAVRSEADANRQLLQAQQAVTQARIDASRTAEDQKSQIAHNALDQQQAALDTAKAEQALAAARANAAASPTAANKQALVEATLALQQQQLRVSDLATAQQRLAADKATADKRGIDGSTQVVAALDRVRAATEQVQKAEQAVSDARAASASQARQSAFAIEQAQQGVINSQRALGQATVSTATAGGASLLALQQSMDALSPAGQRFSLFIYSLKTPLLDLRRTAEAGVLPGVQAGMEALLPVAGTVTTAIRRFSEEVGSLAQRAGTALSAPYWQNFFTMLVDRAIPSMDQAARIAGNFALGLSGLVRAFLPLGDNVGAGVLRFSQEFAHYALTLENTQGYRQLLDYVRTQGPIVAATIGQVVTAAVRLVEAIAPFGGTSLLAIRLLAEAINAIPVPILTGLALGIGVVVVATKGWALVNSALFSSFGVAFVQMIANARIAMELAATNGAGRLTSALSGVRAAAGTLASSIGAGGVLGLALAATAIGIGAWSQEAQKQKQAIDSLKSSLSSYADVLKDGLSPAAAESARSLLQHDAALRGVVDATRQAGISSETLVKGLNGDQAARTAVVSSLNQQIAAERLAQSEARHGADADTVASKAHKDRADQLETMRIAFAKTNTENAEAIALTDALTRSESQLTPAQRALGEALNKLADETATATDKANALKAADEAIFTSARNNIHAQEDGAIAQARWNDVIAQAEAGTIKASTALDLNAASGLKNTQAVVDNRRSLEDRFTALNNEFFADVQAGVAVDDATKKHDKNKEAVERAAIAAGFDKDQVHALADTFGTLPVNPKVQVTVAGVTEALTQMQNLEIAQLALKQGLDPAAATKEWKAQHQQAVKLGQGLATGGPVFGAGGPTDDKIPAWLSNGEHVWTAREVQAAGGHQAVEDLRRRVLGPRGPQVLYPGDGSAGIAFAAGGAVSWPFPVNAAITKIPTLDEIRRAVTFGPDYTGPISGGLEAAAAFVRAQVGKPYVWASAGPGGYDCSGIVSAAFNVAKGRYPYSHTFSTMNEAPYFPLSGYGAFTAGWTNPGEPGPGGSNVGHTAGKIGNMPFESVGGLGVRIGPQVTGIGRFAHIGHFDSGGPLPPGLTIARNDTGKTEWVMTNEQMANVAAGRGGGTTVNVHGSDGMSVHELTQAVIAEMAWQTR